MPSLTQRTVETLPAPATGYAIHWDPRVPGLGLRVTAGGARAWVIQYRVRGSRRVRKATLAKSAVMRLPQAREKAREWLAKAREGVDPAALSSVITVAELVELYRQRHLLTKKPRSREEDERMLENDVLPAIGSRRLDEVEQGDIERILARVVKRSEDRAAKSPGTVAGGYQSNRTRALLRLLFELARRWGLTDRNPVEHVARHRERARERLLTDSEMTALGTALVQVEAGDSRSRIACDAIRLLAFTGCRLREVLHLRWAEVDLEAGVLRLEDTKTGARAVWLSPPAAAIVARQTRRSEFVFPSSRRDGRPMNDLRKTWSAACEKAGIAGARPHDLRHRFASSAASAGFSALEIKPLTGHRNVRTLERYVHAEDGPARRAAERVQAITAAMLDGRGAAVRPLAKRRR
jgi:integrase